MNELWPNALQAVAYIETPARPAPRRSLHHARASAPSTGCCPSRSATRATPRTRCTRTGTTSSRCAASRTPSCSPTAWATTTRRRASRRCATAAARPARLDRRGHRRAQARLRAGVGGAGRLRSELHRDRASRPAASWRACRRPQTAQTFQRYYEEVDRRRSGEADWDVLRPYELRTVGALVRLGQRDQALDVLDEMLAARRPLAWNQWAGDRLARRRGAAVHRRHAAHLGRLRLRRAPCATCSPTSARTTARWSSPPAFRRGWLGDDPVGVRRAADVLRRAQLQHAPRRARRVAHAALRRPQRAAGWHHPATAAARPLTSGHRQRAPAARFEGDHVRVDEFPADVVLESAAPSEAAATPTPSPVPDGSSPNLEGGAPSPPGPDGQGVRFDAAVFSAHPAPAATARRPPGVTFRTVV